MNPTIAKIPIRFSLWLAPLLVVAAACSHAVGEPREVFLIRHAEKPADLADIHLTAAGKKRADALAGLFQKSADRPAPLHKPNFIFAAKQSKRSNRPVETVTPLAGALHLSVNDRFENADYAKLAADLLANAKYDGKSVLICWHHGHIPDLARRLNAVGAPDKWKDSVFDQVWVLKFADDRKVKFTVRHESLLPGDEKD